MTAGGSYSTGRRRSDRFPSGMLSSLSVALDPLWAIISALTPDARLTAIALDDGADWVEVLLSRGHDAIQAPLRWRWADVRGLRAALIAEEAAGTADDRPEELRWMLESFGFGHAFVAPLHSWGAATEAVVIDRPGQERPFGEHERSLLAAAVSQACSVLENADLHVQAAARQRTFEALARLGVVFTSTLELSETAEQVVQYGPLVLDMPGFVLLYRRDDESHFEVLAVEGVLDNLKSVRLSPEEAEAILPERPARVDLAALTVSFPGSLFQRLGEAGFANMLAAPLVVEEKLLRGILLGLDRRAHATGEGPPAEFRLLAQQATNAIWNAERYEAEVSAQKQAWRELDTTSRLLDAADALAQWIDLDDVLVALAEVIIRTTDHRRVTVSMWDDSRRELRVAASRGEGAVEPAVLPYERLAAPMREVVDTGRTRLVDLEALPEQEGWLGGSDASRLALLVPLVHLERFIGLLAIDDPGERGQFGRRDIRLIEAVTAQAAVAIENARLFQREHEAAALGSALAEADGILHSSLDAGRVVGDALSLGARVLDADSAAVSLYRDHAFHVAYAHGFEQDVVGATMPENLEPHSLLALRSRSVIAVEDVATDSRVVADHLLPYGIKSVIVAPLVARDEPFACVYYNFAAPRSVTTPEMDFVRRLASSLSLALENARLYENERQVAETLQEALLALPRSIPGVRFAHTYRSAAETARVGGDFYDLFELDDGMLGITVGDISGKGLNAAVLTSLVKNTVRAQAMEERGSPAEVLRSANTVLYRGSPEEAFATVFFGILDRRDGRLLYCNGGHTTSVVARADGKVVPLPANSPLVGALRDVRFTNAATYVEAGDTIFLYTDGLIEARSGPVLFGEERVFELLAGLANADPEEAVRRVAEAAVQFAGGSLADDLAMLAIQREEPASGEPRQQRFDVG